MISASQGGITASQYLFNWGMGAAALENFAGKTQTGKRFQSWKMTGLNMSVTGASSYIGGVAGIGINIYYETGKLIYKVFKRFQTLPVKEQFNFVNTQMIPL